MACNAIATARAQVSSETLAKLLTDELVSVVAFDYLRLKYKGQNPRDDSAWSGVCFVMGGYRINILNGGVKVTGGWNETGADCAKIAADLAGFLTKTAGLIFQKKTRKIIAARYAVTEEHRTQGGAIVLSVEL